MDHFKFCVPVTAQVGSFPPILNSGDNWLFNSLTDVLGLVITLIAVCNIIASGIMNGYMKKVVGSFMLTAHFECRLFNSGGQVVIHQCMII